MKNTILIKLKVLIVSLCIPFQLNAADFYWVGGTGDWSDYTSHWVTTSGGTTFHTRIPTTADDIFFDASSFTAVGQVVTMDIDGQCKDMHWTGATGTPTITGTTAFDIQIGGDVTFITAMNWDIDGTVIFRYTDSPETENTIVSSGKLFRGNVDFHDNNLGTGVWELGDDFITNQILNLVAGTFSTSTLNHQLTAEVVDVFTIADGLGNPIRELNLNGSTVNVTLDNGLVVDFRGNTNNFSLISTSASQLRLLGNGDLTIETGSTAKTIPNIEIVNTGNGNSVDIESSLVENSSSRITFRDITVLQDGLVFSVNGRAPKTYGAITFPDGAIATFYGVDNDENGPTPLADRNKFNGAVTFGQNTRIDWYDDNIFDAPVTITSTTNDENAIYMRKNNHFTVNAPVTFVAGSYGVTWSAGATKNRVTEFLAPVNILGSLKNVITFYGDDDTEARFRNTLFIQSSPGQEQAFIDFRTKAFFHDQVEFGEFAGGNNVLPVRFRRGMDFSAAPAGTQFITRANSRVEVDSEGTAGSVFRDMNIGENNILTFNKDLTIDNMNLSRFDLVYFPNSDLTANNSGTTTITGLLSATTFCYEQISIRSNLPTVRADINFQNPHLSVTNTNLDYILIQDIENISGNTIEAAPGSVIDLDNNVGINFIGGVTGTTYYWVANGLGDHHGNWSDANGTLPSEQLNHWALISGGTPTGCIPSPKDNVVFDENSFTSSTDVVILDNFFSYCKDMTWQDEIFTISGVRPRLEGDNKHILQIYGNLRFPYFPTRLDWNNFRGLTEFKGTSIPESKTIESNGSRFRGPVEFDSPVDNWTLADSVRINAGDDGNLTINYGELISNNQNIRLDASWTINAPTGSLPQGRFIAGTGTVTFYGDDDANITVDDFQTGVNCLECTDPTTLQGCNGSPFYNITNEKDYDAITALNTTISIYNNFHIVGGSFQDNGFQIRGNIIGTMYMANNTLLRIGADDRATMFPTCYPRANITLANGTPDGTATATYSPRSGTGGNSRQASIVEYQCPDPQLIRGLTYGTLYLISNGNGNHEKRFTGSATIEGSFIIDNDQQVRDMGFQITGNDFTNTTRLNRLRMDNNSALYLGTNQDATQNIYPVSGFEPDGITFPPTNTEFSSLYGSTNVVPSNIATQLPKFTNSGLLDDRANGGKMDLRNTSYIVYNSGSPQEVAAGFTYSALYLRASGLMTIIPKTIVRENLLSDDEVRIGRELRIEEFNSLIDDGNQIIGEAGAESLDAFANTKLILGTPTIATLFPTNFERREVTLDENDHETVYNSSVVGNDIAGGAGVSNNELDNPIYGNLTLRSASGSPVTKNLLGNIVVRGDLTIENENTLEVTSSDFNINLAGDWTCNSSGIFNSQQGRVILDGTDEQRLTTNAQGFYELEASTTGGSFRMMDDITIKTGGQTIFNTGLFNPDDIALGAASMRKMIFEENATIGGTGVYSGSPWVSLSAPALSANGPSDVSHVVGKVEKRGTDPFMFPIGNGTVYAPAGLGGRNSSSASFEARYVGPRVPTLDGYDVDVKEPTITTVSNLEYWIIDRTASSDAAFVYLSWDNPRSDAYVPEELKVLRWDGSIWTDQFNGGHTDAVTKGVVASTAPIAVFSPYTLGTDTQLNPLPLNLLYLDANVEGKSVKLAWKTTKETDNSQFIVERSKDGRSFSSIGRIDAKGTGLEGTFDYQFWDIEPFDGHSYYRLQMFDLNGTYKYSPLKSILFSKNMNRVQENIILYPNPNKGGRFYLKLDRRLTADAYVEILDMLGRKIYTQNIMKGSTDIVLAPVTVLKSGTYTLRFVTPQETITTQFIVN